MADQLEGTHNYGRRKVPRLADVEEGVPYMHDGWCTAAPTLAPVSCTWCGQPMTEDNGVFACNTCDMRGAWPDVG